MLQTFHSRVINVWDNNLENNQASHHCTEHQFITLTLTNCRRWLSDNYEMHPARNDSAHASPSAYSQSTELLLVEGDSEIHCGAYFHYGGDWKQICFPDRISLQIVLINTGILKNRYDSPTNVTLEIEAGPGHFLWQPPLLPATKQGISSWNVWNSAAY